MKNPQFNCQWFWSYFVKFFLTLKKLSAAKLTQFPIKLSEIFKDSSYTSPQTHKILRMEIMCEVTEDWNNLENSCVLFLVRCSYILIKINSKWPIESGGMRSKVMEVHWLFLVKFDQMSTKLNCNFFKVITVFEAMIRSYYGTPNNNIYLCHQPIPF